MDGGESQFGCCIIIVRSFFLPVKTKILQGSVTSVLVPDTDGTEMHPQPKGVRTRWRRSYEKELKLGRIGRSF